ncbi:6-phosphogluconolactonase [Thermosynechococcus sp. QKsg1]|uniref:6-phosphogluconolactonase n=1 Tax=unclassified Thermosynechococcus TaxID=2622553 RepID=UPI00122E5AE1|nr:MULTISPECIES: 6-phosphogluconolactonase [unclassified Thermosynechococcus]QEQ01997.1 6-phosphogluconolactonase [Thermosynechococcus sp. CL-1]WJI23885.1 6-phosphogluconolactonase [Thermosynechococcus sp. B0]WJI26398.1 6-phosphogluconolactonase [Thermosynechococcus sp. B1]WJI28925.1 6-phosphogluconolactonase [Thermosynechococcus sp. B3]WKT83518.1 6-phosphogluconolactonase [Thermosynechococcus sp. HY596]
MPTPNVRVFPDLAALTAAAKQFVLEQATGAIAQRGQFTLALAGGNTPKPLYESLVCADTPWSRWHIFWGDERYVPLDHPDSNAGMAFQAWLNHVPIPKNQIHPMPTADADPQTAADRYEQILRQTFGIREGEVPSFDLILLGMGPDGHTASLFPHTAALTVGDRLITVGNKDGQPRLTFTVPLINHTRQILFLVTGANKQTALRHIFSGTTDPHLYPARLITGNALWFLDAAAAEGVVANA